MSDVTRKKLENALLFIDENLDKKLTSAQIAEHANLSKFHFQRLFGAYMGESLHQYVLHRQLERSAQELLSLPDKSIIEIAIDSGFETHSAFSRAFRQHFNICPSRFRVVPGLAKRGRDHTRPLLKTVPAPKSQLKVRIENLPEMYFNYRADKGTHNGTFLKESQRSLTKDFSFLATTPHLFGVGSAFPSSPQSLNDPFADIFYGGFYLQMENCGWSTDWRSIRSGLWAICEYRGSYDYLYQTWSLILRSWLPNSEYELREDLSFERYLTSPENTPKDEWLTEIYLPVKSARSEQIDS